MSVVSDATAITTLLKAGEEHLLRDLFGSVIVPQAVWNELLAFHRGLPDFVSMQPIRRTQQALAGIESKSGRGEAEAITLALEISADVLLTDDRKARLAAVRLGLK